MFLKRIRVLSEDAFGPPFRYSMNEALLIISTLVEVLANKTLASMVASYVGQVPILFEAFRDTVIQYLQHNMYQQLNLPL